MSWRMMLFKKLSFRFASWTAVSARILSVISWIATTSFWVPGTRVIVMSAFLTSPSHRMNLTSMLIGPSLRKDSLVMNRMTLRTSSGTTNSIHFFFPSISPRT